MSTTLQPTLPEGTVPGQPQNASAVIADARNLSQYIYVSTVQSQVPGYKYQYKSQTERLQTLMGKLNNPQSIALRVSGGQGCGNPNNNL
jgi:hypothetical protein